MAALFLTNGAVFANLVPRLPELKTELGLTNAEYGIVVAAFPAGALVAGLAAAQLIRRFTSARVAVAGTVGIAALVLLAGAAATPAIVAVALFAGGACDALVDVAQNTHGLRVQRVYGRSIINSLHAVWSAGAVLGGLMGAAAIALHVSLTTHLAFSAAVFSAVALGAAPFLLRGPDREPAHGAATSEGRAGRTVYLVAGCVGRHRDSGRGRRRRGKFLGDPVSAGRPRSTGCHRGVGVRGATWLSVHRAVGRRSRG